MLALLAEEMDERLCHCAEKRAPKYHI
jgi:hypothetical protein